MLLCHTHESTCPRVHPTSARLPCRRTEPVNGSLPHLVLGGGGGGGAQRKSDLSASLYQPALPDVKCSRVSVAHAMQAERERRLQHTTASMCPNRIVRGQVVV
ncbi:hypothetical protein TcWFU_009694 [Taenia crassiceps]|uniref:Uncharacterized protein n=1 Tax=Taenia crassiceps TaxID=6207 RepID=A0ABR4QRE7_9CEST